MTNLIAHLQEASIPVLLINYFCPFRSRISKLWDLKEYKLFIFYILEPTLGVAGDAKTARCEEMAGSNVV